MDRQIEGQMQQKQLVPQTRTQKQPEIGRKCQTVRLMMLMSGCEANTKGDRIIFVYVLTQQ